MRAIVVLVLIMFVSGCATSRAPIAMADPDPAVRQCMDGHPRQKDLTLRRQRVKQNRARGLSSWEDERKIARYQDEMRAECEVNRSGAGQPPPDDEE